MLKKMGFIYPIYEYANYISQQLASRAEVHSKTIICLMLWCIINLMLNTDSHSLYNHKVYKEDTDDTIKTEWERKIHTQKTTYHLLRK